MKLSVATNWKADLIPGLASCAVAELYGSLPHTPVGSGRPTMLLPDIHKQEAEAHIRAVHEAGWGFNYLLNGLCLGGAELRARETELLEHLEWIEAIGVRRVTVAHPSVLQLVKARFPGLAVKMSVLPDFNTVSKIRQLEALGADEVALSIMSNRDFEFLEAVIGATSCPLTLLVNQACLFDCPHRLHHGSVNAHASRRASQAEWFGINYCLIKCSLQKLSDPVHLIKSRWIRPEDLPAYEGLGYRTFKIAGREMSTRWLVNAARAYSARAYQGNLAEVLNGIAAMLDETGAGNRRLPWIDNRSLDGFIDQFRRKRCLRHCVDCSYCRNIASRSVNLFEAENTRLLDALRMSADCVL